jgi:hypothetical protein
MSMTPRFSRPSLALGAAAIALAVLGGTVAPASAATTRPAHAASAKASHSQEWLLTADPSASSVYIADATTGRRTGTLTHIAFGTHAGTIQLGAGRVAFMDESKPRLDVVQISSRGVPRIVASYPVPNGDGRWERAGWLSTDTTRRYIAIGSDFDGSTHQRVTVVDLQRHRRATANITTSAVTLTTTGERGTEEMETFLVGTPLRLVVSAGGHLDAYRVSQILAGDRAPRRVSTTALGAYPHGPIVASNGSTIGSTLHAGIQTVRVTSTGFGRSTTTAYPVASVQSYRPRMAPDGTTAVGTQAGATAAGTAASATPALLTSSSTRTGRITTVNLGLGTATRAVVSSRYAAAVVTRNGVDTLHLVSRGANGLFAGRDRAFRLPGLGQSGASGSTARFLAVSDDGSQLFLSRAGTSSVLVIDVTKAGTARVRGTIAYPSALPDAGYLATIDPTQRPYDLSGR